MRIEELNTCYELHIFNGTRTKEQLLRKFIQGQNKLMEG